MTENKRYVEINNELWNYMKDNETTIKYDLNEVCDLLNEQNARIKYLERKLERERCATQKQHLKWSEQAEKRIRDLKETIIKITIAYQRKHDNTIVNLVDEVWEEDISGLIKEYGGDVE